MLAKIKDSQYNRKSTLGIKHKKKKISDSLQRYQVLEPNQLPKRLNRKR